MNKVIVFLSALFLLSACGSQSGYKLKGTIEGAADVTVYLQQRIDKEYVSIDSVITVDGTFEFSGKVEIPDVYYISIPDKRGNAMFFLENSSIYLTAHADTLWTPDIKGSAVHDEYLAYEESIDAIYDKLNALWEEFKAAEMAGDTAIASELESTMDDIYEGIEERQKTFIDENSSSFVAPFIVQSLHYGKEADEIQEMLNKLDPALEATTLVSSMRKRVEVLKMVAIGEIAPDFIQADPEGNPVQLISLRGNYLLIDFWAAWCGPCRRENPNIVAAYQKYHEKGFDVLGVSLDNSKEDWLKAIQDDNLTWNHVSDVKGWSNEAAQMYGISSIPSSLLIDPDGKIIAKNLRGEDLHAELEKLLAP
ncbi:MAG TPA: AhpC/TSA family protein [Bacteroides sp.]|nr:AhpC/TSA family protein [Bacteroides sp.]